MSGWPCPLRGQVVPRGVDDEPRAVEDSADDGVTLLGDRARERQLEQARRLFAEERWSDAAMLCDEILAAPGDAFLRRSDAATRRSLKTEVATLLRDQPPAARRAYELVHGARAERDLDEALARDDHRGVLEVARRWFHTPAGREAALIAAYVAVEDGQTAVATSWIERLAGAAPAATLASLADHARSGGFPDAPQGPPGAVGDWRQHRGVPSRNAVVTASRPLLAARYRVPLARSPDEARLLREIRQDALGRGQDVLPAGSPVVVGDRVVVQTGWGLLAIEFATGKRLWLGTAAEAIHATAPDAGSVAGGEAPRDDGDRLHRVFDDATAAGLTTAAGLVVAVEPAVAAARPDGGPMPRLAPPLLRATLAAGNTLAAYDLAGRGTRRWRLPADGTAGAWYLGPPLAVGDTLFSLVEEKGGVRLDCIDARAGTVQWSQPLAELEEQRTVTGADGRLRRLGGFTPALADGVLVCPIGAGTVIAIDLATRSLSWAHRYKILAGDDDAASGRRRGPPGDREGAGPVRVREAAPVIAGGRVLLTPPDSDRLICLDLRDGTRVWPHSVDGGVEVAGVVDGRVIVVGPRAVEALALEGGHQLWRTAWSDLGGQPSGRGIVTPERLLLPLDSAEVVELGLADGTVITRNGSRGGVIPGNLIACRGEILSRGLDSLDVFHQVATLERRIETAALEGDMGWAGHWRGELDLERGRVAEGLAGLFDAAGAGGWHAAPDAICDAVMFALRKDFAAAVPTADAALASPAVDLPRGGEHRRRLTRAIVSGHLEQGNLDRAWDGLRRYVEPLLAGPAASSPDGVPYDSLVADSSDRSLMLGQGRWARGRLAELHARGSADLRRRIDTAAAAAVAAAVAESDPIRRLQRLESLVEVLGRLPAAADARGRFIAEHDRLATSAAAGSPDHDGLGGIWGRRRDALTARPGPGAGGRDSGPPERVSAGAEAWPLGRVTQNRGRAERDVLDEIGGDRMTVVPVAADGRAIVPGMVLVFDARRGRLLVRDRVGRLVGAPLPLERIDLRGGIGGPPMIEASTWGRLLVVRSPGSVTAFDLGAGDEPLLWALASRGPTRRDMPLVWPPTAGGPGGRAVAHGRAALGMIVAEVDDASRAGFVRGGGARSSGVLHHDGGTLTLLDPVTGARLWERHGLVRVSELVADEEFVCVVAPDGQESLVLSMDDGRAVRRCEAPRRRERLGAVGRRVVVVRPVSTESDGPVAAEVCVSLFDPVSGAEAVLGVVPGESRAVLHDERLYVLAPHGEFIAFALDEVPRDTFAPGNFAPGNFAPGNFAPGKAVSAVSAAPHVAFRVPLAEMPAAFTRLHVIPHQDRLLVVAGAEEQAGAGRPALRLSTHQSFFDRDIGPPLTGAIWAVDPVSGAALWTAPARIDGYGLPPGQPSGLPLLLLCRHLPAPDPQADGRPRLALVCLDTRTGHAVLEEPGLRVRPDEGVGCDASGDPAAGTVTVRQIGGEGWRIVLQYTGEPLPPLPPFRADAAGSARLDGLIRHLQIDRSR